MCTRTGLTDTLTTSKANLESGKFVSSTCRVELEKISSCGPSRSAAGDPSIAQEPEVQSAHTAVTVTRHIGIMVRRRNLGRSSKSLSSSSGGGT